jgi:hypothetical protein
MKQIWTLSESLDVVSISNLLFFAYTSYKSEVPTLLIKPQKVLWQFHTFIPKYVFWVQSASIKYLQYYSTPKYLLNLGDKSKLKTFF